MADRAGRVEYLDGIRGVAILCVLGVHVVQRVAPLGSGGYIGVDVFFVLSGFVITRILIGSPRTYGTFLRGRVKRLYPPLMAVLVALPVLVAITPGTPVSLSSTVKGAALGAVQATSLWAASGRDGSGALEITWSLAVEWYFYVLWPLAVTYGIRRAIPLRRMGAAALGVGVLCWVASATVLDADWFYFGPTARFGSLLLGCSVAYLTASRGRRAIMQAGAANTLVFAAGAIIATYTLFGPDASSPLYRWIAFPVVSGLTAAVVLAGVDQPRSLAIRVLGWRPLSGLGLVSYSLYLWHVGAIRLFGDGALGIESSIVRNALGILLMAAATAASYLLLERPRQGSAARSLKAPGRSQMPS